MARPRPKQPKPEELARWGEASTLSHTTFPTPRAAAGVFRHAAAVLLQLALHAENPTPAAHAEWENGPEAHPVHGRPAFESLWATAHGVTVRAEANGGWVVEVYYLPPETVGEERGGPCCPHGGGFSPAES